MDLLKSFIAHLKKGGAFEITTQTLEESLEVGRILGSVVKAGTLITLSGGLGSGKTSFVQGFARGLEVPEGYYVTSPTYNIINEYPGRHTLYHIDLYRIGDESELEEIGFEEIAESDGVVAIEWPERLSGGYLDPDIHIQLESTGETSRKISFSVYRLDSINLLQSLDKEKNV